MTIQITLLFIGILLIALIGMFFWLIQNIRKKKLVIIDADSKPLSFIPQALIEKKQLESQKEKYANSKLSPEQQEQLLTKLITHLEHHKSYRNKDLTLKNLAAEVEIPPHHISQIINDQTETGFIHFINRYRVQEAIELLTDANLQHTSIVNIGNQVGFNSKSTFYAAFKKYNNCSPGDYRSKVNVAAEG